MSYSNKKVLILGAGRIGFAVALLLEDYGGGKFEILLGDHQKTLDNLPLGLNRTKLIHCDASIERDLKNRIHGCDAVISCLPYYLCAKVAEIAIKCSVHYLDLTESLDMTRKVASMAKGSLSYIIPQCGLAPGFVSMAATDIVRNFERVDNLQIRVGALPIFPSNRLKYNLLWSTDGLINEYIQECEGLESSKIVKVKALEGYELFHVGGDEYEAFHTSGGCGSAARTLEGKVKQMHYKTIRYRGHREQLLFLLEDLGFRNRPAELKTILEQGIPATDEDKVIIWVQAEGVKESRRLQMTRSIQVFHRQLNGVHLTAIQITTASGVCGILDLLFQGKIPRNKGLVRVETLRLEDFLDSEFAQPYSQWNKITTV